MPKKKNGERIKNTDIEIDKRVDLLVSLILQGYSRRDILGYTGESTDWNVCENTIDSYLAQARQIIQLESKERRQYHIGETVLRLGLLFKKSFENDDYKNCLSIQNTLIKLLALDAPVKTNESKDPRIIIKEKYDILRITKSLTHQEAVDQLRPALSFFYYDDSYLPDNTDKSDE